MLVDAEIRAKQKFTPNKFRTPEWESKTSAMRTEVDGIMDAVDTEMYDRAAAREDDSEDDE